MIDEEPLAQVVRYAIQRHGGSAVVLCLREITQVHSCQLARSRILGPRIPCWVWDLWDGYSMSKYADTSSAVAESKWARSCCAQSLSCINQDAEADESMYGRVVHQLVRPF